MVVSYKECLKNHAASLGGHALDGCGEFMPTPTANSTDPSSLKCAACGCHRNFHRRDPYDPTATTQFLLPPPPSADALPRSPSQSTDPSTAPSPDTNSPRQQPVTSPAPCSYYSSAPHMLLALSTGYSGQPDERYHHHQSFNLAVTKIENPSARKRSRTKFSKEQKEKMFSFAEKLGWRMNRGEERLTEEFCSEVGVSRRVFKVWMHNNKQALGKKGLDISAEINNKNGYTDNGSNHSEGNVHPVVSPKSED